MLTFWLSFLSSLLSLSLSDESLLLSEESSEDLLSLTSFRIAASSSALAVAMSLAPASANTISPSTTSAAVSCG